MLAPPDDPTGWVAGFRPAEPPESRLWLAGSSRLLEARDGPWQVVFDGFLTDRGELDRELDLGSPPETTDAVRVLAARRRFGDVALERLRGGFVVLIHDSRQAELTVVRDPVGQHPLFYAQARGEIVVSPDVRRLARHPKVSARLDRVVVAEYLLDRFGGAEETFWHGIRRLPGGHRLRWSRRGLEVERFWDPLPKTSEGWIEDDVEARFEEAFERAVARCRSLGPAAVFLSGGVDSVSVAAVARDQVRAGSGEPPLALSLLFPHPEIDEAETQRRVAAQLGLDQVAMEFHRTVEPGGGLLGSALQASRSWPVPLLNFWLPAYARLARAAKERGAEVLLTGTGGDEWLSVTPYWAADLWLRGDVPGVWKLGHSYLRSQGLSSWRVALNLVWLFAWRPVLLAVLRRRGPDLYANVRARRLARRLPEWFAPDPELRRRLDARVRDRSKAPGSSLGGFYRAELRRGLDHPLPQLELEETFEAGRRLGLPWVHPYLDADLISLLARVSPGALLGGGWSKGLVRSLLGRRFPELGVERQRKAHVDRFFHDLFLREGPGAWRRVGAPTALHRRGVVEASTAATFLETTLEPWNAKSDIRYLHRAWQIVHVETWMRKMDVP